MPALLNERYFNRLKSNPGLLFKNRRIDVEPEYLEEWTYNIVGLLENRSVNGFPADKLLEFCLVLIRNNNIDSITHENRTTFHSADIF